MGHDNRNSHVDLEKLQSTWKTVTNLMTGREWSVAVAQAAMAAEIGFNIALKHELQEHLQVELEIVDHPLSWATGLAEQFDKLLRPLRTAKELQAKISRLRDIAARIDEQLSVVICTGEFMTEDEANEIVGLAREFVEQSVQPYHPEFFLPSASSADQSAAFV